MNTTRCDLCGLSEPDVNCKYSRRRRWGWRRRDFDSQGGSNFDLDICETCWIKLGKIEVKK
jgi:hypothetical protein